MGILVEGGEVTILTPTDEIILYHLHHNEMVLIGEHVITTVIQRARKDGGVSIT